MKYLQSTPLEALTAKLSRIDLADSRIMGRVEAYSCKSAGDDKKLYRNLEFRFADDMEDYGPSDMPIVSPFGPLDNQASRKTLFYLISTLNASYPDYDFSSVKPEQFCKQPHLGMVVNSINVTLGNAGSLTADVVTTMAQPVCCFANNKETIQLQSMWPIIDAEIQFKDCDIYVFTPDLSSDPAEDEAGSIWSMYYFFYNKKLKRIVFFTCRAISHDEDAMDEEEYGQNDSGYFVDDSFDGETAGWSQFSNSYSKGVRSLA